MDDESESESESDSEPEPAPPGEEMSPVETGKDKELLPPGVEAEAPSIDESLLPPGEYWQKSVYWLHLTVDICKLIHTLTALYFHCTTLYPVTLYSCDSSPDNLDA